MSPGKPGMTFRLAERQASNYRHGYKKAESPEAWRHEGMKASSRASLGRCGKKNEWRIYWFGVYGVFIWAAIVLFHTPAKLVVQQKYVSGAVHSLYYIMFDTTIIVVVINYVLSSIVYATCHVLCSKQWTLIQIISKNTNTYHVNIGVVHGSPLHIVCVCIGEAGYISLGFICLHNALLCPSHVVSFHRVLRF